MMSSIREAPQIYMSSGKLALIDLRGFHVSTGRKFSYLCFSHVSFRASQVDVPRNPLAEEVVNSTHVY